MRATTKFGPCLAGDTLFFTGNRNPRIYEAIYTGEGDDPWDARGRVTDGRNSSKTACEPSAIKLLARAGSGEESRYYIAHVGMSFDNDRIVDNKIWYRSRALDSEDWGTQRAIPDAYSTHAPSIALVSTWFRRAQRQRIMVAFRTIDDRITLATYTGDFWDHTPWCTTKLPDEARTSIGPTLVNQSPGGGAEPEVLYRAQGRSGNGIYYARASRGADLPQLQWDWDIERIPSAYTNQTIAAARISSGRLIIAFTGHNNNYIWIRLRDDDGWRSLGYVEGVATEERPALGFVRRREGRTDVETLYLAFKPLSGNEICVGILEIDDDVGAGRPGHSYVSIRTDRPDLDCG